MTGTITRDYVPGGAQANKVWFQRENMLKVIDMLERWQPLCARYQCTIPTLALAWILKQSDLISILRWGYCTGTGTRKCRGTEYQLIGCRRNIDEGNGRGPER